jgi:hypothetical protein
LADLDRRVKGGRLFAVDTLKKGLKRLAQDDRTI